METSSPSQLTFDLSSTGTPQILAEIRKRVLAGGGSEVLHARIENVAGQDFVCAGWRGISKVEVQGRLGDFCFCSFGDGDCSIEGNTSNFLGHSMQSGALIVRGHAGHSPGALATGGLITIYGNAGERCGVGLQGGDIVVRGSVGKYAGLGMQAGTLVVGGSAGPLMGQGMRGGAIYLRGEVESLSPDIEEYRLREPDRLKIGLLMLKAGIKSTGKEFRAYRPIHPEA